jgi:biopolymer transport protein TolQ
MSPNVMVVNLAFHHGIVVQLVLACLAIVSLASWTLIFQKWAALRAARRELQNLQRRLQSNADVAGMFRSSGAGRRGLEGALAAGMERMEQLRHRPGFDPDRAIEHVRQAWEDAVWREIRRLDANLAFLATVGSLSPYIGLFGTVWGIMGAMSALGDVHELSLASVAPGIAEALVATAAGLFAAIPAIFAHNRFASDIERLADEYLGVVDELGFRVLGAPPLQEPAEAAAGDGLPIRGARVGYGAP